MSYLGTLENPLIPNYVYKCELDEIWNQKIGMFDGVYLCIKPYGRRSTDQRIFFLFNCSICGSYAVRIGHFRKVPNECRCYQIGIKGRNKLTAGSWKSMRLRCLNNKTKDYQRYGGRGIKIQKEWNLYQNFVNDMGDRPTKNHVIDRIDPNGNYEKSNCRWVLPKQSSRNTRRARKCLYNGVLTHIFDIADKEGISTQLIADRWSMGVRGERLWKKGRLNAN